MSFTLLRGADYLAHYSLVALKWAHNCEIYLQIQVLSLEHRQDQGSYRRRTLKIAGFNMVVLDEVDRMLDMGFINE